MSAQHLIVRAANVAAIDRPKMAYRDVEKIGKIKVLNRFDSFLFYLGANMYGCVCLTGSRECVRSVIIKERDSAFIFSHLFGLRSANNITVIV